MDHTSTCNSFPNHVHLFSYSSYSSSSDPGLGRQQAIKTAVFFPLPSCVTRSCLFLSWRHSHRCHKFSRTTIPSTTTFLIIRRIEGRRLARLFRYRSLNHALAQFPKRTHPTPLALVTATLSAARNQGAPLTCNLISQHQSPINKVRV